MTGKSRRTALARPLLGSLLAALAALLAAPAVASAHGPTAPVATSYLARLGHVRAGLDAKIVDGYVRLWLRVPASETVVVLDYRGAPYLRFLPGGVQVNERSEMYFLNQTPSPWAVPAGLTRTTPPRWVTVSGGHTYEWHDGRLQALAAVALAPGESYVGRWAIPLMVNGHLTAIAGGLWHAPRPSLAWFWPIAVLLACVLAAWRVRNRILDTRVARALGVVSVIALATAGAGRELHGRPGVTPFEYSELAVILVYAAWALHRVLFRRPGYFTYFVIAFVAFWQGVDLFPTLTNGFVLIALPAVLARITTIACLAGGASLALLVFRLADEPEGLLAPLRRERTSEREVEPLHEVP